MLGLSVLYSDQEAANMVGRLSRRNRMNEAIWGPRIRPALVFATVIGIVAALAAALTGVL